jgi:hypothetical protein
MTMDLHTWSACMMESFTMEPLSHCQFNEMKIIIQEHRAKGHNLLNPDAPDRNSASGKRLKAQCGSNFKCCHSTLMGCCLKKIIYSEPDFQA